jgi:cytochrome c oxidase subunit 2
VTNRFASEIASLLAGGGPGYMPARASSVAGDVDQVFWFIFWVSAFFFALIVFLSVLFVVRYRHRASRPEPEATASHHTGLELLWTGIPLALVLVMFAWSTKAYLAMTSTEAGAEPIEVQVTAKRWSWWFDHPGGKGAPELHLVAHRPATLVLSSTDVIHSLYVPEFRLKQDAVPGRFTRMTFTPNVPGTYPILCTEYCGTDHSRMLASVVVHADQAAFDAWAREGMEPGESLVEIGRKVFAQRGCAACHSLDGSRRVGPTVKGLWGKEEKLADGTTVQVDEEYLRESILKPGAKVVAGFPNVMPPSALPERDLKGIVAYLQSLKETP